MVKARKRHWGLLVSGTLTAFLDKTLYIGTLYRNFISELYIGTLYRNFICGTLYRNFISELYIGTLYRNSQIEKTPTERQTQIVKFVQKKLIFMIAALFVLLVLFKYLSDQAELLVYKGYAQDKSFPYAARSHTLQNC